MHICTNCNNRHNHTKYLEYKQLIRKYLTSKNYQEVEVPTLAPVIIPEGYLGIFETELDFFGEKEKLFLTPHPEIYLKRLLHQGYGSVFCISRSFRNQEMTTHKHSPEFDMLEMYKIDVDYMQLAEDVLGVLQTISQRWFGSASFVYCGKVVDCSKWDIITVDEAFEKYAGVTNLTNHDVFFAQASALGYTTTGFDYTEVWSQIYADKVENNLGRGSHPTLIKDYPRELGATARFNPATNRAERWEFYIDGVELGNAANEQADLLTLPELQAKYELEMSDRDKNRLTPISPDLEFATIIQQLPRCSGIGIGLERLCAVLLDLTDIRDLKVSWVE